MTGELHTIFQMLSTVREVGAMIYLQRAIVNGWDGTPINRRLVVVAAINAQSP